MIISLFYEKNKEKNVDKAVRDAGNSLSSMKRRPPPPPLQFLAAATSSESSPVMSSHRPAYRGIQCQIRRGVSDQSRFSSTGQFVTTDSHFQSVGDANRGFRPLVDAPNIHNQYQPSPVHNPLPHFYPPRYSYPPRPPPFNAPWYSNPHPPPFNRGFRLPQHFRPRPPKPLNYRNWEYPKLKPPPQSERFKVLSYNLLADYLANNHRSKLYFHIPPKMLEWEWRKRSIIFELGLWSADILCFQEVDKFWDLEEELKLQGYRGIWKMRTGAPVDGCAIFWHVSRFKLLHEECIEFNKLGLRDNVAQICVFESLNQNKTKDMLALPSSLTGSNKVVICNIHVLYNPRRGEIKLGQIRVLLDRAHAVSKLWDDAPVVLSGDFNFTPKSPLYNYIADQKLDLSDLPRDKLSGQGSAEIPPMQVSLGIRNEGKVSGALRKDGYEITSVDCRHEDLTEAEHENQIQVTIDMQSDSFIGHSEPKLQTQDRISSCEKSILYSLSSNDNTDAIPDPTPSDYVTGGKTENLPLEELPETDDGNEVFEDSTEFLSELHDGNESFSSNFSHAVRSVLVEFDEPSKTTEPDDALNLRYDPSTWTPMEIETATGNADCKLVENPLKLRSTYTEVEDCSGTRDSNGEPMVTSYNRCFLGTVDYIWRSEGLQTVGVLAPLPKHAMQWTPGFPTKKWGSDHIALVSELAFVKDRSILSS